MPFNGSGVFQRLYNWVTDRDGSVKISAPRMDAETDGIVAGLNAVVSQTQPFINAVKVPSGTAALPGYAFTTDLNTGAYNPAADQWAVSLGGVQALLMTSTAATTTLRQRGPLGSIAEPAYSFAAYPGTGISATSMGVLVSALGDLIGNFNTENFYIGKPLAGSGAVRASLHARSVGGTANAITLACFGDPAIVAGTQVRFVATAANTGSVTIALDGRLPESCATVTNTPLPADYIRTDAVTVATYTGSSWTVDREPEVITNANGRAVRYADGAQICRSDGAAQDTNNAVGGVFNTASLATWTFPAPFISPPSFQGSPNGSALRWVAGGASGTTSAQYRQFAAAASATELTSELTATGEWY